MFPPQQPSWRQGDVWYGHRTADNPGWPYPTERADPKVGAVIAVLQAWFNAMEEGSAHLRLPDPHYQRPEGKPEWTDADLERIVTAIDQEYGREIRNQYGTLNWAGLHGAQDGPGFVRLAPLQRRALVQELAQALAPFAKYARPAPAVPTADELQDDV